MQQLFKIGILFFSGTAFFAAFYLSAQAQDAPDWKISIDAAAKQGLSRVKNFMFVQGSPLLAGEEYGSDEASQKFEIAAWNALGLTTEGPLLIGEVSDQGGLLNVVRTSDSSFSPSPNLLGPLGPRGDLYLDTSNFDVTRQYLRETFGSDENFLRVPWASYMPKTLSSNPSADNYATYPPADYAEWAAVLEAAVRYINQYGIDDPYIILFGEPESDTIFNVLCANGKPCPYSTEPVLREYVRLFAESQRAVQAADPGAKVSAMCAGVWGADYFRELRGDPTHKGLDDFIQYVAEYNAALPPGAARARIDNICWQGYSWGDEKRMVPMTEHIYSTLARFGFNPEVPQYLSGWSGGWASPQGKNYPLIRYASHLVYNVLEQLNPGGKQGLIEQAHYYTWNLEDESNKSSLVRTIHRTISWGPIASDKNCLRPAYIAFQALKALEGGDVLAMQETRPEFVRSIAVATDNGIRVLVANYTDESQMAQLSINNLPSAALLEQAVLRRVPEDEVCGTDNWFPAHDPIATFVNETAGLTVSALGTVTASVVLASNGVALLDIPYDVSLPAVSEQPVLAGDTHMKIKFLIVLAVALVGAIIGIAWVIVENKRRRNKQTSQEKIDSTHDDAGTR